MARGRLVSSILSALLVAGTAALSASPAQARWNVHNDADVTQITAPPGGTETQTCADRIVGEAGWAQFFDTAEEAAAYVPPASAYQSSTYTVWQAPAGFTDFDLAEVQFNDAGEVTGYNFPDADGNYTIPATRVMQIVTDPRTALPAPIPADPDSTGGAGFYVYSTAPISAPLPATVVPGDVIALLPEGGSSPLELTVVDCSFTASGTTFTTARKARFTGTVATFIGPGDASDCSAVINWGDGRTSVGTVTEGPNGFVVTGTHRYAKKGTYPVTVTVTQTVTGDTEQAASTATVTRR